MNVRVEGAKEMSNFARDFVAKLKPKSERATIVALSGELGAGKTTFAQAAARALGVEETVNSPTFVIEKIYQLPPKNQQGVALLVFRRLIHIDAYRLKNADELRALGWENIVADPANLILIEWPENVSGAIPEHAQRVSIKIEEGEERTIRYGN